MCHAPFFSFYKTISERKNPQRKTQKQPPYEKLPGFQIDSRFSRFYNGNMPCRKVILKEKAHGNQAQFFFDPTT